MRVNYEPPNYSMNPAAGGTAPAKSPRRAYARRGLCVRYANELTKS